MPAPARPPARPGWNRPGHSARRVWIVRFRLPGELAVAYGLLLALTVAAVAVLPRDPGPPPPEAVPAVTGGRPPGEVVPGGRPRGGDPVLAAAARWLADRLRETLLATATLKAALRSAVPGLGLEEPPRLPLAPTGPVGRRLVGALLEMAGGAEIGRPWTLLAAELPAMHQVELPEPGPAVAPVASLLPDPWSGEGEVLPGPPDLERPPPPTYERVAGQPAVLIYHTHTSEAYLGAVPAFQAARADALAFSADEERNIVRVGKAMAERFRQRGVGVLHLRSVFDRTGGMVNRIVSYAWARRTLWDFERKGPVTRVYPSLRMVLDVHRDHLSGDVARSRRLTTATIGGQPVARVMIVVGGRHPGARTNYCFALAVARLADAMYPGLSRGVLVKAARYNQDLSPGALLLEIGSTFNTLAEAERGARLMADVLAEALRRGLVPQPGRPYPCPGR